MPQGGIYYSHVTGHRVRFRNMLLSELVFKPHMSHIEPTMTIDRCCLTLPAIAVLKQHDQRDLGAEMVISAYSSQVTRHHWAESGWNRHEPEAESEAEPVEECCLLECSLCFLIHPRTVCPGVASCRDFWDHLSCQSLIIKCPTVLLPGNPMVAFSQLRFLFPDSSSLVEVNKKPAHLTKAGICTRSSPLCMCWHALIEGNSLYSLSGFARSGPRSLES